MHKEEKGCVRPDGCSGGLAIINHHGRNRKDEYRAGRVQKVYRRQILALRVRPHSSLGYQTPEEFAAAWSAKQAARTSERPVRLSVPSCSGTVKDKPAAALTRRP